MDLKRRIERRMEEGLDIQISPEDIIYHALYTGKWEIEVKDHRGRPITSVEEMAKYHKIDLEPIRKRAVKQKYIDKCMTPTPEGKYKDPFGNFFDSLDELLEFHHTNFRSFCHELYSGKTFQEALIPKPNYGRRREAKLQLMELLITDQWDMSIKDLLGNPLETVEDVAAYYRIDLASLWPEVEREKRAREGLKKDADGMYRDHLGNSFETKYQLAQYHGISETTLNRRVSKGLTLQECLVPVKKNWKECTDHLGNVYPSMEGMAYHYNIKIEILRNRLYNGWTLEEALTRPVKYIEPGKEKEPRKSKAKKVYTLDPHSTDGSLIFST